MKSIKKKPIMILLMAALMATLLAYAHAAKVTAKRSLVWTIWRAQK